MKLVRIELQGFKSFVDRTVLDFSSGITAILGPNGCGKSNIVDAVRWVLGEQSPKTLRGDRMEDIIFKGTTKRKPVGLAEVSLTFNNEDRGLPIEFDEVSVKRKVTRDGGSDYFLNGSLCRLKDLRDLFYDSGVNNASYSIIEQAMINIVLDEHAQELRRLIEEGSGITKYKARRKETQRKLDRTDQDLLRLNDIIEEIDREVRSLRYQVGKAKRHQRLFNQIRALDLLIADRQRRDFDGEESALRQKLAELQTLAEADSGELASLRAEIEAVRPALDERQAERKLLEEARQAYEEELQETERRVLSLEHRIEDYDRRLTDNQESLVSTQQRQEEIHGQIHDLNEHLNGLNAEIEQSAQYLRQKREDLQLLDKRLASDRDALDKATQLNLEFIETDAVQQSHLRELQVKQENRQDRITALNSQREQLQQDNRTTDEFLTREAETLDRLNRRRRQLLQDLARLEREEGDLLASATEIQEDIAKLMAKREAVNSRFELLKRIKEEYQGYGRGAQQLLQNHTGDGRIWGGLADQLQVDTEYTVAFETLLAELLDAVIVDGTGTAMDLVAELRQQENGPASFLCGTSTAGGTEVRVPSPGRPAREVVHGKAADIPAIKRLLGATALFESDDDAVEAAVNHAGPMPLVCLSRSGLLITSDGMVRGGRGKREEAGLLGRGEKLEKLTAEIAACDREMEAWQQRQEKGRQRSSEVRDAIVRGRGELSVLDEDLRNLHVEVGQHQSRRQANERRLGDLEREQTNLAAELTSLTEEEAALSGHLAESGRQRNSSTTRLDEQRHAMADLEHEREKIRTEVEELRLVHERQEGRQRETEATLAHLRESVAELGVQQDRLGQESELGRRERETLREELSVRRQQLDEGLTERERRRQLVRVATDAIQDLHDKTAAWHERIKEIEDKRNSCREDMHAVQTNLATLDVRRKNLHDRIAEQYEGSFTDLVRDLDPNHIPRQLERDGNVFQLEQAQALLSECRDKLGRLGPVNQLALEEYETKKARLEFLEGQRADVLKAKEDLITAINRINRTARRLFGDTFEEVRRNFIAVFQTLFEGGRADLQLLRTDDPLESNIHIIAQPRGKVVNHVGLLSGGERCLTALSLLFAVYLVKPSPFCMLDEVDAPLDDANIQRFVKMLREFSKNTQFLVVTHNKLTMETANHLYGVTMMEQGCSSIVSVTFDDVAETQSDAELSDAIATRRRDLDRSESVRAILADEDKPPAVRFTLDAAEPSTSVGGIRVEDTTLGETELEKSDDSAPVTKEKASEAIPAHEMEAEQ